MTIQLRSRRVKAFKGPRVVGSRVNNLLDLIYQDRRRGIVQLHSLYSDGRMEFTGRFNCPPY